MSWGGRSHAPPLLVHAGRPDSVRQRGRIIWCRPNRMKPRRGTSGTVVEVQTASTQTIVYAQQQWRTVSHASWSFGCDMKGVSYFYVTAKKKNKLWTSTCICLYVRVTLTLQHVFLLTLEGMLMYYLVMPTAAVEAASATLAQCPDGTREISQIRQL